jgi:hypothetical protein
VLIIKERSKQTIDEEIFKESLHSLLDVVIELELNQLTICKGDVAEVEWANVRSLLTEILTETQVRITICLNEIIMPEINEQRQIIQENHETLVGGHKGMIKTFNRIKQNYFWPRMKRDVEKFINNCKGCQLKKLLRIKPRQPMILTDTPNTSFDKISMDVMGPLPVTEQENILHLDHSRSVNQVSSNNTYERCICHFNSKSVH